jgi:hypothetical protein
VVNPAFSRLKWSAPEIVVGQNRLAIGLLKNKQPTVNAKVHERFYYLDAPDVTAQQQVRGEADAIYYSENLPLGVYVTHPVFDKPGAWGAEITAFEPSANQALVSRVRFSVSTIAATSAIGTLPPASHNRTLATELDITKITSDDHPDPDLYRLTVADALKSGKPTLVLFATPRYCVSRMCSPTLEMLKGLKQKYGDQANFIHIEIYQDFTTFVEVPEIAEWRLPSEPWLFMLDRLGPVVAKYEGGLTRQEIEPALVELLRR